MAHFTLAAASAVMALFGFGWIGKAWHWLIPPSHTAKIEQVNTGSEFDTDLNAVADDLVRDTADTQSLEKELGKLKE